MLRVVFPVEGTSKETLVKDHGKHISSFTFGSTTNQFEDAAIEEGSMRPCFLDLETLNH